MDASDSYLTIAREGRAELKEKGSRFIAEAFPVDDAEEAEERIASVREREHSATHHCTAYRVGAEGDVFRYNDDGEPTGTAGPPILRQIDGRDLTNTLVVVTRYYGGTKLGTGGLVRAYGGAAAMVLDDVPVRECIRRRAVRLRFDYDDTSPAMRTLDRFDAEVWESRYTDDTVLVLGVRLSDVEPLVAAFTDALGGRGEAKVE